MAIEQLRNIGGVIYMDRGDGRLVPLSQVRTSADVQAPPRADAPMSMSAGPAYSFGDVGRGVGNEELSAAYDTLSNATNVGTYDPILAAGRYVGSMGKAGLLGAIGAGKKVGGYAADALGAGYEALGGDRFAAGGAAEAIYRDMGAGIQAAGVGPEARMLDVLASAGAGRSAVDAADLTAREALAYARSVGEGDLAFLRGGGVPQSVGAANRVGNVDPAVSRGQGILDMLKAGRGADVTDKMLDMGDPVANTRLGQYLYQNYDLPMDHASRIERAGQMGFDVDSYHGTGDDFPAFDTRSYAASNYGVHSGAKEAANTILMHSKSKYDKSLGVSDYPNGSAILPLMAKTKNNLRISDTGDWHPNKVLSAMAWSDSPSTEAMYRSIEDNPSFPRFGADDEITKFIGDSLSEAGNTGFTYRNDYEGGGDSYATLDPANIRSRFARFDPRLAHLRNLSAAAAGTGLLGVGMQSRDRQEM